MMEEKRLAGTTRYTVVHHRETPRRIEKREVDVGPVWATEALHARSTGVPFEVVEPGEALDQRDRISYHIARRNDVPHPEAARCFIDFILSDAARDVYARYGFVPPTPR